MTADRPYFLTTPIYYVNDLPHLGHAYTTVACDALARFMRLDGQRVKFLTGSDEHGQKVEQSARAAGIAPQEFCDRISPAWREMTRLLNISNDDFIRTTEPRHMRGVAGAVAGAGAARRDLSRPLRRLVFGARRGVLRRERADRRAQRHKVAPTGAEVEWLEEENYFFRLSAWQDRLLAWYEANPDAIAPRSRRNEVISFVKSRAQRSVDLAHQLQLGHPGAGQPEACDLCLARRADQLHHRARLPGYRAASSRRSGRPICTWSARTSCAFTRSIGTAFLMAAGLEPPRRVFAHGWWTVEGPEDVEIARQLHPAEGAGRQIRARPACAISCCASCRSAATAISRTARWSAGSTAISPMITAIWRSACCR